MKDGTEQSSELATQSMAAFTVTLKRSRQICQLPVTQPTQPSSGSSLPSSSASNLNRTLSLAICIWAICGAASVNASVCVCVYLCVCCSVMWVRSAESPRAQNPTPQHRRTHTHALRQVRLICLRKQTRTQCTSEPSPSPACPCPDRASVCSACPSLDKDSLYALLWARGLIPFYTLPTLKMLKKEVYWACARTYFSRSLLLKEKTLKYGVPLAKLKFVLKISKQSIILFLKCKITTDSKT